MKAIGLVLGFIALFVVSLAPTSDAVATTSSVTYASYDGLPSGFAFSGSDCTDSLTAGSYSHVVGPATPPIGSGSLQLNVPADSSLLASDDPVGQKAVDLTALTTSVFSTTVTAGSAGIEVDFTDPNGSDTDDFDIFADTANSWTSISGLAGTATRYHDGTAAAGETVASFIAANPSATLDSVTLNAQDCGGTAAFIANFDNLTIGLSGQTTTYNFEPQGKPALTISAPKVTSNGRATITGKLTGGGMPQGGSSVELIQKPTGASMYENVGPVVSSAQGSVSLPVLQPNTTSYEWEYIAGDGSTVTSPAATIGSETDMTIHVPSTKIKQSQRLSLFGVIRPAKVGQVVTIFEQLAGSKTKKVGTSKVQSDGTYGASINLKKGSYKIFASSVATKGYLPPKSPTVKVVVT